MHRIAASLVAYSGTVILATAATAAMSGVALAQTPTLGSTHSAARSRDEVRAEVLNARGQLSSAGTEWVTQQGAPLPSSNRTRRQATAEYIAARDEVGAMNSEAGGDSHIVMLPARSRRAMFAERRQAQ